MADSCDRATADSPFFTVLPPEVRVAILTAAFGGRTVHIQRCLPAMPQPQAQGTRSSRAIGSAKKLLGGLFATKTKEKKEEPQPAGRGKQWAARICDGVPDPGLGNSPSADTCMPELGSGQIRGSWSCINPPDVIPDIAVGAIGWLLTCWRAYNEGIKVLYASNTFHVRTGNLRVFGGFVPQFPAVGLSYITSVEFVLDRLFTSEKDLAVLQKVEASEFEILESMLSLMPQLMPSLKGLYLGFCPGTCLKEDCESGSALEYECTKHLVSSVEALARQLGQMGRSYDIELGLTPRSFEQYNREAIEQRRKMGISDYKMGMPGRYLYPPRLRIFWPVQDQRCDPVWETDKTGGSDIGYWMSESQYDIMRYHVVRCFGT